jgi:phosphoribosylanthranilate isomerase
MSARTVAIKMCGLRSVADVDAALDAGADMLGIVFVPDARRAVAPAQARSMINSARARGSAHLVAVVGGAIDPQEAATMVGSLGFDAAQLVGDDAAARATADLLGAAVGIMRTVAVDADDVDDALAAAAEWEARGARIIFEPRVSGSLGGAGVALAPDVSRRLFIGPGRGLAGGLDPNSVAAAISSSEPAFVDVSSGIERDGHKDPQTMRSFVAAVRGGVA